MATRLAEILGLNGAVLNVTRYGRGQHTQERTGIQLTPEHDDFVQFNRAGVTELIRVLQRWLDDPMYEP